MKRLTVMSPSARGALLKSSRARYLIAFTFRSVGVICTAVFSWRARPAADRADGNDRTSHFRPVFDGELDLRQCARARSSSCRRGRVIWSVLGILAMAGSSSSFGERRKYSRCISSLGAISVSRFHERAAFRVTSADRPSTRTSNLSLLEALRGYRIGHACRR